MSGFEHVELQRQDDPTLTGYDGKCIMQRDGSDNVQQMSIPAGKKLYILDSAGRRISEVDEATGDVRRIGYGAGALGPVVSLDHDSASPAVDDVLGKLTFRGKNDGGSFYTGVELRALAKNVGAGTEEVWFEAGIMKAGTFIPAGLSLRVVAGAVKLYVDGGEMSGVTDSALTALMPKVRGTRTTTFAVPQNSETAVELSVTSVEDTAGMHDSVTNSHRVVSKLAGWYRYEAHARFATSASSAGLWYFAVKDNAGVFLSQASGPLVASTANRFGSMAGIVYLALDAWIALYAYQNIQASLNVNSDLPPYLSMQRIGA